MKKGKDNKNVPVQPNSSRVYKLGRTLKEVIPPSIIKNIRENINLKNSDLSHKKEYIPYAIPSKLPPEWPNEEEIKNFNSTFNLEIENDIKNEFLKLPVSMNFSNDWVRWLKPEEYIKNYLLDKEIRRVYPNKQTIKMRNDIKDSYKQESSNNKDKDDSNYNEYEKEDEDSRKKRIYKEFYKIIEKKLDLKVVHSYEREETEEEKKKRIEEEESRLEKMKNEEKNLKGKKDDKKQQKGKIEEKPIIIENIKKIEINPGNTTIIDKYDKTSIESTSEYIRWISSVYQSIKDLNITDAYSGKSIWHNIYPQNNGIPIHNPNGVYWVKLYFMGKPCKIEVNDLMPCNSEDEYLFPRCDDLEEIWPAIFTKALIKLNTYKDSYFYYNGDVIGDISILYQLTGYIGIYYDSKDININIFSTYLNDECYEGKKNFFLCMNKQKILDDRKSQSQKKLLDGMKEETINTSQNVGKSRKSILNVDRRDTILTSKFASVKNKLAKVSTVKERDEDKMKKLATSHNLINLDMSNNQASKISSLNVRASIGNIILNPDYSILPNLYYSIPDFFDNKNFNMKRLKPLDFSDLKNILKQSQDNYKAIFKQLTKEQRKTKISEFAELRKTQKQIKEQRIEDLKQSGKKFCLVKVKNDMVGVPHMNFLIPYADDEIFMAKKCILNKWEFPPPSFFDNDHEAEQNIGIVDTINPLSPIKKPTIKKVSINDDDFSIDPRESCKLLPNSKPWNRDTYLKELLRDNLEKYIIQKSPIVRNELGTWIDLNEIRCMFNQLVILNNPNFFNYNIMWDNNWNYYMTDIFEFKEDYEIFHFSSSISKTASFLMLFQPNTESDQSISFAYSLNFYLSFSLLDSNGEIINDNILLNSFFSTYIYNEIQSDEQYFLIYNGGFSPFGFFLQIFSESHKLENMSHNNYLHKFRDYKLINFKLDHSSLEIGKFYLLARFKVNLTEKTKFRFVLRYPDKYAKQCVELYMNNDNYDKNRIYFSELISIDSTEGNDHFFLSLSLRAPYDLSDDIFDLEIVYDNPTTSISIIEYSDPYEIHDRYLPNKHGIVFKEFIYAGDILYSSFEIKIRKELSSKSFDAIQNIDERIRMKLELYKANELLSSWEFYNSITLHHLKFEGVAYNPPAVKGKEKEVIKSDVHNIPYLLICYFDLTEIPAWLKTSEEISWIIRVFSSETLGFVKDTTKEDMEKALKDSWEISEPGRAEKAKKSRTKYLLKIRKDKGELLSPDEEALLNEERERKIFTADNNNISQQAIKEDKNKKNVKKTEKEKKPVQKPVEEKPILPTYNRELPKVEDHTCKFIREFISYNYEDRLKIIDHKLEQEMKVINNEEVISDKINLLNKEVDDYELKKKEEFIENSTFKNELNNSLKSFFKSLNNMRKQIRDELENMYKDREVIAGKIQARHELEKQITDCISNNNVDFNYALNIYKEALVQDLQVDLLFNFLSQRKEESLKNDLKKLTSKDKNTVLKLLEDIEINKWIISEDTIKKLNDLSK